MDKMQKVKQEMKEFLLAIPRAIMGLLIAFSAIGILTICLGLLLGWISVNNIRDLPWFVFRLVIVILPGVVSFLLLRKYRKKSKAVKTVIAEKPDSLQCEEYHDTRVSTQNIPLEAPIPQLNQREQPAHEKKQEPEKPPKAKNMPVQAADSVKKPEPRKSAPKHVTKPSIDFLMGPTASCTVTREKDGFCLVYSSKEYAHSGDRWEKKLPADYFETHSVEEFCVLLESGRDVTLDRSVIARKLLDAKFITSTFVAPKSRAFVQQSRILWSKGHPDEIYEEVKVLRLEDGWYYQIRSVWQRHTYYQNTERIPEGLAVEADLYLHIRSKHDYPDFSNEDLNSDRPLNLSGYSQDVPTGIDAKSTVFCVRGWDYMLTRLDDGRFRLRHSVTHRDGGYGADVEIVLDKDHFQHHGLSDFYDYVSDQLPKPASQHLNRQQELAELRKSLQRIGLFTAHPQPEQSVPAAVNQHGDVVAKVKVSPVVQQHYWMSFVELRHEGQHWNLVIEDVFACDRWTDAIDSCVRRTPKPVPEMTAGQLAAFINTIPPCGPGYGGHRAVKPEEVAPLIEAVRKYLRD